MKANNVIQFKREKPEEPVIDSDYFGSEKIPVSDLLSLLDLLKQSKDKNGNS